MRGPEAYDLGQATEGLGLRGGMLRLRTWYSRIRTGDMKGWQKLIIKDKRQGESEQMRQNRHTRTEDTIYVD